MSIFPFAFSQIISTIGLEERRHLNVLTIPKGDMMLIAALAIVWSVLGGR